jgi:hypothetical protein
LYSSYEELIPTLAKIAERRVKIASVETETTIFKIFVESETLALIGLLVLNKADVPVPVDKRSHG